MTAISMKQLTGRHVLFMLIGFFGVMLMANAIFVYFALSTFRGLENPNAYQDGVNYNLRIEAGQKQAALGWSHEIVANMPEKLELHLFDKNGEPLTGLIVSGALRRPIGELSGELMKFEEAGGGIYRADLKQLEAGNWIVSLEASRMNSYGPEILYRIKERLWLKPNS